MSGVLRWGDQEGVNEEALYKGVDVIEGIRGVVWYPQAHNREWPSPPQSLKTQVRGEGSRTQRITQTLEIPAELVLSGREMQLLPTCGQAERKLRESIASCQCLQWSNPT